MTFLLKPTEHVGRDVKRTGRGRIDDALARLDRLEGHSPAEIESEVHEIRKRCKEVRGLARLVGPALGDEFGRFNRHVRDAAAELSAIRDAHAVLATLDRLRALPTGVDDAAFAPVRARQAELAARASDDLRPGDVRLRTARRLLAEARRDIDRWDLPAGFDPIASGLGVTYGRGRRALRRARRRPTDERVHEWRKAVKQLWYQIRLLEPASPSTLRSLSRAFDDLADALGDDHDLAVLRAQLAGTSVVSIAVAGAAEEVQDALRVRAFRLGSSLYAEPRTAFVDRLAALWAITLDEGPELPTGGLETLFPAPEPVGGRPRSAPSSVERERKFLVISPPELPEGTGLRQGYLAIDGSTSVRVRDAGQAGCTMTIKSGAGAVRGEWEWVIDRSRFDELWVHTAGRRISKSRSLVPIDGKTAEVDVFHDELSGLIVAEVEFDDAASMTAFTPPAWFGPEVTDDLRYTNASLATNGLEPEHFGRPPAPA